MSTNLTDLEQVSITPTAYAVEGVIITTNSGKEVNITELVHDIRLTEGLHFSTIFGEMLILDAAGFFSEAKLSGNERIQFMIGREEPEQGFLNYELDMQITDIDKYSEPHPSSKSYRLMLVSKHAYLNNKKLLNLPFDGDSGKLINNIVKTHLNSEVDVRAKGDGVFKGIYPNIKPLDAISWLLRNSHDSSTPVFFHDSVKDGLVLTSYKKMLEGEVFNKYNKNPEFQESLFKSDIEKIYEEERCKIRKLKSSINLDKLTPAEHGTYGAVLNTIDISTKTKAKHHFKFEDEPPTEMLNEHHPVNPQMKIGDDKLFDLNSSQQYYHSLNEKAFDMSNYHKSTDNKGMMKAISADSLLRNTTCNIDIAGDFNLTLGKIVELEILKYDNIVEEIEEGGEFKDEYTSGKYLVTRLVHHFGKNGYFINATLKKDSYTNYHLDEL